MKKTVEQKTLDRAKEMQAKKTVATEKKVAKSLEKKPVNPMESKKELKPEMLVDKNVALKSFETVFHPLITEKSVGMIESENKLVFVVNDKSDKSAVKSAVENLYKIKVDKVNILRDSKGRKRAFVKINKEFKADEIATRLGVL